MHLLTQGITAKGCDALSCAVAARATLAMEAALAESSDSSCFFVTRSQLHQCELPEVTSSQRSRDPFRSLPATRTYENLVRIFQEARKSKLAERLEQFEATD